MVAHALPVCLTVFDQGLTHLDHGPQQVTQVTQQVVALEVKVDYILRAWEEGARGQCVLTKHRSGTAACAEPFQHG